MSYNIAVISSMTQGLDGPKTCVKEGCPNVLVEGKPACTSTSSVVPHKKYGSDHLHKGNVLIGQVTSIVIGNNKLYLSCGETPVSCGDKIDNANTGTHNSITG